MFVKDLEQQRVELQKESESLTGKLDPLADADMARGPNKGMPDHPALYNHSQAQQNETQHNIIKIIILVNMKRYDYK